MTSHLYDKACLSHNVLYIRSLVYWSPTFTSQGTLMILSLRIICHLSRYFKCNRRFSNSKFEWQFPNFNIKQGYSDSKHHKKEHEYTLTPLKSDCNVKCMIKLQRTNIGLQHVRYRHFERQP